MSSQSQINREKWRRGEKRASLDAAQIKQHKLHELGQVSHFTADSTVVTATNPATPCVLWSFHGNELADCLGLERCVETLVSKLNLVRSQQRFNAFQWRAIEMGRERGHARFITQTGTRWEVQLIPSCFHIMLGCMRLGLSERILPPSWQILRHLSGYTPRTWRACSIKGTGVN